MVKSPKIIRACTVPQSLGFVEGALDDLQKKYEVVLLSSPGPDWERVREKHPDVKCIEVPMERHISLVRDFKALVALWRVFRMEKPMMVHSMTPKAGMLCMVASWMALVPVRVHTFTGLVFPTSVGLKRKILMATDWLTCACATHIIPEGQGVLDDLTNHKICRKAMQVLGYGNVMGVDMERFSSVRFKGIVKNKDEFRFVFVGRVVGDKGVNELVEAFVRLNKEIPNTRLAIVGGYETHLDPLNPETQNMIDNNKNIDTLGTVYGDALLVEYLKSDCFVMPSYREGFPNTVLEAGALGLPSIVTDINGSREIIINGKNGLIVPSKNADALYHAMKVMVENESARKSMAANSRPLISSRFEKSFVQSCLINYYKYILGY